MTKPHVDKDEEALQPRESAATREAAPTTQTKKRKVWWIVLALIATLVIAGLVMGLVLGLDDDEEEEDEKDNRLDAACIMATNALYANNPELDQFMENLDRDEWTQYELTGERTVDCTIEQPSDSIDMFKEMCEDAGGVVFAFDDVTLRCSGVIPGGVGDVTMNFHVIFMEECFASVCDMSDDEVFEEKAMTYNGLQTAADVEEINKCYLVD